MTYTATVTREGSNWLAEVSGLPGAHAYARTLTTLRKRLTDAIILSDDLEDDAQIDIAFEIKGSGMKLISRAFVLADERLRLRAAEAAMVAETANVAKSLIAAGWSVRDAAGALDVSPGRISQLVNS